MAMIYRATYVAITGMVSVIVMGAYSDAGWNVTGWVVLAGVVSAGLVALLGQPWVFAAVFATVALTAAVLDGQQDVARVENQVIGLVLFAVLLWDTRRSGWLMTGVTGAYVVLVTMVGGTEDLGLALDDCCLVIPVIWASRLFVMVFEERLEDLDVAHSQRVRAELDEEFGGVRNSLLQRRREILHDDLIGTLTSLARPGEAQAKRVACAELADSLVDAFAPSSSSTQTKVRAMVQREAMASGITVEASGPDVVLQPTVAAALRRAVAEALRNVRRHAGVDRARVSWQDHQGELQFSVVDSGVGVVDGKEGWGISHSIRWPLEQAGGSVRIGAAEGGGTEVSMRVPLPGGPSRVGALERAHSWTTTALAGKRRLPFQLIVLQLVANVALALRRAWGHDTFVAELVLMVAIVAMGLLVGGVLMRRALRPLEIGVMSLAIALLISWGLELRGLDSLASYDSWFIGLALVVLTVVSFYLPLWVVLTALAPSIVVMTQAVTRIDEPFSVYAGAAITLVVPLVAYALGSSLRASWDRREDEWARATRAALSVHRRQVTATFGESNLVWAREELVPWLRRVARGDLDPDDPEVMVRSANLAVAVRDELNVPGVLDRVMRRRLQAARRLGVEVIFMVADGHPDESAPAALRVLDRLLDHAEVLDRVVVRFSEASRRESEVTWVAVRRPGLDALEQRAVLRALPEVEVRVDSEDGVCTWTWSVNGRSDS